MQLAKQSLSIFVSFSLFLNQCLYAADLPIEIDTTAAAKHQATLDKAPNGVQIVNIVNPNSKGMSHNKFKEYNVNPSGLILNNSKAVVNTQLAGYISYNPNLTNNASVILNEVTGTNKSLLKGYSEVAGARADVIVANPNGITVNGGGFINTNKATLTTGRPSFLNGFVNGFDINSGQILIEGDGLNTTNINKVELYSKALQVNAKFYANNLKVATGDNFVDLNGNVTSRESLGSGVSIDSSLLGGIYANRIELISSDKGVGVNLPPEVFAQDSIVLNSAGDILLSKVTANNNIDIATETFTSNNGSLITTNGNIYLNTNNLLVDNSKIASSNDLRIDVMNDFVLPSTNTIEALNDLTFNISSMTNNSTLKANNNLNITATNIFTNNNATGELRAKNINLTIDELLNNGLISSLQNMILRTTSLTNTGGISSLNNDNNGSELSIYSDSLTNYNTIFSNGNINLYIKNSLINKTDSLQASVDYARIMANNFLNIQGNDSKTLRTQNITNEKAIFSTLKNDINIYSDNFINIGTIPELEDLGTVVESTGGSDMMAGKTTCYSGNSYCQNATTSWWMSVVGFRGVETSVWNNFINKYPILKTLSDGRNGTWANMYNDGGHESEETWTIALVEKTGQKLKANQNLIKGQVISANNLNIDSTNLTNKYSLLKANNDITLEGTTLDNIGAELIERQLFKLRYYKCGGDNCSGQESLRSIQTHTESIVTGTVPSVISAGNDITGNLSSLLNESIKDTTTTVSFSDIDTNFIEETEDVKKQEYILPTNDYGLFITSQKTPYLIETNPLYTSYNNFVGSDYMLEKLNYKPENTIRRLGDARYENQLVKEAILKKTGVTNDLNIYDNSEYLRLMNNAITFVSSINLEIGIAPTKEQLANLTEDIVWLEEKIVNNELVLVPVVYLASDYNQAAGIQAGGKIDLNVSEKVINSGDIKAKDNLTISSKSIINDAGDIKSNALVNLTSQNDLVNKNGASIIGDSVKLISNEGSVVNDRFYKKVNEGSPNDRFTYTLVGKRSNIEAKTGSISIEAKKDIKNLASNITSGKSVYLKSTDGNIDLKTKEIEESYNFVRSDDKYSKGKKLRYEQASISADENIIIDSGKEVNIEAANLSTNNQMLITAKDDVNVTAVNNLDFTNVKNKIKKSWGSSISSQDMKYKESVVSSNLTAKNILINSDKDVTLEAAKLKANENIIVDAKEDINVVAKQYKEGELHYSSKSSFGGLISSASMDQKESLKLNSAELEAVGKNIVFKSGDSVKVIASKLSAQNGGISIDAAKDILLSAGKEQNFEEKWSKKSSLFQDGEIISSKFDLKGKGSTTGLSTELNSKDLTLNSGNDTTVLGSDLNTSGNTAITTGGEFSQASIEEVFYQYEEHKKTSLKFNLKAAQQFAKDLFNQMKKNHTLKGLVQSNKDAFGTIDPGISIIGGNTSINLFEAQLQKSASNNKDTIQKSSNINSGGTVDINSNKGINVASSNINANGDINLKANDDINIHTLNNQNETSDKSLNLDTFIGLRSSGIDFEANYNKSDFSKFSTTAQGSEVNTNSNLNIDANNTLVEGSNINVGKNLTVNVQNDFNVIASTNSTGTSSYTFDAKSQSDDESKMKIKDAKIVMDMGEATVDKVKKTIDKTTKTSSNINVGENINVNSGNDILVEGSNLKANEDINLTASNNVDIKEAKESTYTNSEEFHGKAAVSVEVKHQAIEIVKAVKALNDAKKKAKQAKNDYKQYKSDLANLEQQLSTLTTEYDNKTPGITKADLEELKSIIQDVRSDESWYKKSIVLAEANLAMQSLFLAQQIMGLSKSLSSYAWGFDAGINLNIDTILQKANAYATSSVGSNINANNINLTANNQANVQGSNLYANNDINVNANEVNLLASSDKSSQEQKNEHANFNYNYSIFGGSTYTASYDRAKFDEATTTFTNSNVSGNNINITSTEDTNVKGANVNAQNKVDLNVGKDLNVVSVQNRQRSDSKSLGLNFSYSRSQDGNSSGSSGFTTGKSKSNQKQTVVTSITGKEVNVDVNNETYLQGSTIASIDENGNDNNNLNLKTNTLKYDDLSNTSYASNKSMGASISWSTKDNSTSLNKTSIQYSNNLSLSKDKTLSTVGEGNLEVTDTQNSDDLERLNRDVNNTTKEIYDVNRQMGNIDVTIDNQVIKNIVGKVVDTLSKMDIKKLPEPTEKQKDFVKKFEENFPNQYKRIAEQSDKLVTELLKQKGLDYDINSAERETFLQLLIPLALASVYANTPQDKTDVQTGIPQSAEFTEVGMAAMIGKDLANGKNIAETAIDFLSNKLKFGKVVTKVPDKVDDVLSQINKNKGNPPNGYKGNSIFENKNNKLPTKDESGNSITYKEYDVNPTPPKGTKRDSERILIGSDGKKYYTNDHYDTFTEIK
ncbi:hemagglutinin repeat-containing protein [Arcobacter sp.]|uniref:hemagglutinin repeat-containing protein n=1 Tax=Arcobacter sp. TaxID=1872629 RepID=UPI003D09E026